MMFLSLNSSMTGVTIEAETADSFRATQSAVAKGFLSVR